MWAKKHDNKIYNNVLFKYSTHYNEKKKTDVDIKLDKWLLHIKVPGLWAEAAGCFFILLWEEPLLGRFIFAKEPKQKMGSADMELNAESKYFQVRVSISVSFF